jgi:hypothetical protein
MGKSLNLEIGLNKNFDLDDLSVYNFENFKNNYAGYKFLVLVTLKTFSVIDAVHSGSSLQTFWKNLQTLEDPQWFQHK